MNRLGDKLWFQMLERGWRPLQSWGLGAATVGYAFRPSFDMSFDIQIFVALAAVSFGKFVSRGLEKVGKIAASPQPEN